ncbi:helix-turn-helix domain-containing protein [Klebsiella aerogenes]|uniref:helix-turn-helix domain-containing protein n=1 Tax=Klebsiella aerogenes TaxID=548 RepID=UPI0021D3DBD9|nr:helix-turn-helix domain-containing protein [Klebsiella aerogenes]MCU6317036.1 helix-turn-helix domain-containing protein [Klebsiella aerogenes]
MPSGFEITEQTYLTTNFQLLRETLLEVGRLLYFTKGTVLQTRKDEILIIISGQMTVSDSSYGGLALGHTFPYMPVGLMERYYQIPLYYQAEEQTAAIQLVGDEFDNVFFHHPEHAESLTRIMAYMSSILIQIYYERNHVSGYATIREMLHRYLYKAKEGSLNNEGIATFILKRTRLSRSYVFQILAALKAGEYITVRNGKLISINRDIPERF